MSWCILVYETHSECIINALWNSLFDLHAKATANFQIARMLFEVSMGSGFASCSHEQLLHHGPSTTKEIILSVAGCTEKFRPNSQNLWCPMLRKQHILNINQTRNVSTVYNFFNSTWFIERNMLNSQYHRPKFFTLSENIFAGFPNLNKSC